jgi:Putative porin
MKKIVLTLTAVMIFAWQGMSVAASSVDALIQKLEDKGILTDQDANQLKGEIASNEQNSQQNTFKSLLPDWLNSMKLTGDFRLRDQWQVRHDRVTAASANDLARNRGRMRARLNVEDQVNDKLKVIVGIATNGESGSYPGNDRSNNITFGGNGGSEGTFNKSALVLNKAYAIYTPASYVTLMGGQMDNPIWEPASLLWDPDITPIGGVVQFQKKLNDYITPFSTSGFLVVKDQTPSISPVATNTKTDPYIFFTQDGIKGNLTEKVYYKAAGTYYNFSDPNHFVLDNSNATNELSTSATGGYDYNFELLGGAVELGMNDPFGELLPAPIYIPQVGVFGSYFQNLDPSHQNAAWDIGAYMGSSAINGFGTWKLQSYWKVLERNSWMDALPDDDFYSGDTDTEGLRTQLDVGLAKNVWMTLSYFHTNVYKYFRGTTEAGSATLGAFSQSAPEDLWQMDLNFKF